MIYENQIQLTSLRSISNSPKALHSELNLVNHFDYPSKRLVL